jgi:hypothetical protein
MVSRTTEGGQMHGAVMASESEALELGRDRDTGKEKQ